MHLKGTLVLVRRAVSTAIPLFCNFKINRMAIEVELTNAERDSIMHHFLFNTIAIRLEVLEAQRKALNNVAGQPIERMLVLVEIEELKSQLGDLNSKFKT